MHELINCIKNNEIIKATHLLEEEQKNLSMRFQMKNGLNFHQFFIDATDRQGQNALHHLVLSWKNQSEKNLEAHMRLLNLLLLLDTTSVLMSPSKTNILFKGKTPLELCIQLGLDQSIITQRISTYYKVPVPTKTKNLLPSIKTTRRSPTGNVNSPLPLLELPPEILIIIFKMIMKFDSNGNYVNFMLICKKLKDIATKPETIETLSRYLVEQMIIKTLLYVT